MTARIVAAALALAFSMLAADVNKKSIDVDGKRHDYFLFVPKSANSTTPAPLLILLHGSSRNGQTLIEPWKKLAEKEGIILVAPNALDPAEWASPADGPQPLIAIVESTKKEYAVDPKRVYVFGHSAGANFGLYLPVLEPRYFAAIAVHAGALTPGGQQQLKAVLPTLPRKAPIQIQVGTDDQFFSLDVVRRTQEFLTTNGFTVDLRVIPRHNHDYYYIADRVNHTAWDFLKDKRAE